MRLNSKANLATPCRDVKRIKIILNIRRHAKKLRPEAPPCPDAAIRSRSAQNFACGGSAQPRPTKGIFVALTVRNCTLTSSGRLAMKRTACDTSTEERREGKEGVRAG